MNKIRFLIFLLFLFSADSIFACMCGQVSISEMYERSDTVVIGKVIGIKPTIVHEDWIYYEDGDEKKGKTVHEKLRGQEITLEVSRWFKGANRKMIITMVVATSSCSWDFGYEHYKKEFLFYLYFNKKYKNLKISSCGRSTSIEDAADDLSWLNGLPKSRKRTRLSGIVSFNDDKNTFPTVSGIKIKIIGNGKEYDLVTDKNGLYEIWDLPAGTYTINAEIPEDKKVSWKVPVPGGITDTWFPDKPNPNGATVKLGPKSNAGVDFMLEDKPSPKK